MTGTFGGALEARGIDAANGRLSCEAVGDIHKDGRTLVLSRIAITYRLVLDADADRAKVERAFRSHPQSCPVYRSIHPQITITTALQTVGG